MLHRIVSLSIVLSAACWAWGQDTAYLGQITAADVRVRTGPGQNYAEVIRLSRPAEVTVVGREGEWLKVAPPQGVYCVVSKRLVKPAPDGATGAIAGTRVNIRAGSDLDSRATSERPLIQLNTGDTVTIRGQTEEYYKIDPPSGVIYWVNAQYVNRTGEASAAVVAATSRPASSGAGVGGVEHTSPSGLPGTVTVHTVSTSRPVEAGQILGQIDAFNGAEAALQAEYKKPEVQQDLPKVLAMYQAIHADPGSPLGRYVDYRIRYLTAVIHIRQGVADAQKELAQAQEDMRNYAAESSRTIEVSPAATSQPAPGPVEGRLEASAVFTGAGALPKRWVIFGEDNRTVLGYVEKGEVDPTPYEGWKVSVQGPRQYNERLKTAIIQAATINRLPGGEPALKPVRPPVTTYLPPPISPAPVQLPPAEPDKVPSVTPGSALPAPVTPVPVPTPSPTPSPAAPIPATPPATQPAAVGTVPELLPAGATAYVVKANDTGIWNIAEKVYGEGKYWNVIAKANPQVDITRLDVGQTLIIPKVDKTTDSSTDSSPAPVPVRPSVATLRPAVSPPPTSRPAASQPAASYAIPANHRVVNVVLPKPVKSFEELSVSIFGKPDHAAAIAKANPTLDPAKIPAGQVVPLVLPIPLIETLRVVTRSAEPPTSQPAPKPAAADTALPAAPKAGTPAPGAVNQDEYN